MRKVLVTGGSGFIGTHLIERLGQLDVEFRNIDINPPKLDKHRATWERCDIKNREALHAQVASFEPNVVIHLAARANLRGTSTRDFVDNVIGTENVVGSANSIDSVDRLVNVSTQYVVRPGVYPRRDEYLDPYTAYGESKAEAERIVRAKCKKCWTILRPTNIWGPMHAFFPKELWRYLRQRLYLHPGYQAITKYYGYVENAVDQIVAIGIGAPNEKVCGRVFYITDAPIDSAKWMNGFSIALSGKPIRRVPIVLWKLIGAIGDLLNAIGIRFPMSSARLFRLTVNESVPYESTIAIAGEGRISLEEGIKRSVRWYRTEFCDYR